MTDEAEDEVKEKRVPKAELIARAKAVFDLVLKVRMHGAFRTEAAICRQLGFEAGNVSVKTLEQIDQACKKGDTSRGSTYVDKGLVYGTSIYKSETGYYRVGYQFLCKASDE